MKADRAQRKWSQAELARQAHCSESSIAMVESYQRPPTASLAKALDKAFGTSGTYARMGDRDRTRNHRRTGRAQTSGEDANAFTAARRVLQADEGAIGPDDHGAASTVAHHGFEDAGAGRYHGERDGASTAGDTDGDGNAIGGSRFAGNLEGKLFRAGHVAHAENGRGDTGDSYRVGRQAGGPGPEEIGVEHHALNVGRQSRSEYGDQTARRESADPGEPAGVIEAAGGNGRARGNDGERERLRKGLDGGTDGYGTGGGSSGHGDSRLAGGIGKGGERGKHRRAAGNRKADGLVRQGLTVGADHLHNQVRWEFLARLGSLQVAGYLGEAGDQDARGESETLRNATVGPGESSPDDDLSGGVGRKSEVD